MFVTPRPKKSVLPLPSKKRKAHTVEEISFDNSARHEYLTGFHKRKVQRKKHAQEVAAQKAREEKIEFRKQIREERKQAVEDHVREVNQILKNARAATNDGENKNDSGSEDEDEDEWGGFDDDQPPDPVDHEAEYVDEDRYTTVTVESVVVDRDGLHRPDELDSNQEEQGKDEAAKKQAGETGEDGTEKAKKAGKDHPKKKKKQFRYESKHDRQIADRKAKAKKGHYRR